MNYDQWIDEKIYWLSGTLGINSNLFYKNFNLTQNLYHYFESGKTKEAQIAVDIISKNLEMVSPVLKYDWQNELNQDDIKGEILNGQLIISLTFTFNKYALSATTIHELMHYFLIYRKNINLPNNLENEKLTDLLAMVIGFKDIMINGKVINKNSNNIETLGYLSLEEISYAYKKITGLMNTGSYNLNYYAQSILDGTIKKQNNNNFSSFDGFKFKENAQSTINTKKRIINKKYIINKLKQSIHVYKSILKKIVPLYQKKVCPFCRKKIRKNSIHCKYCKRSLIEKI